MLVRPKRIQLFLVALLLAAPVLSAAAGSPRDSFTQSPVAPTQVPEFLGGDPYPSGVALGGGYIFWTKALTEFCTWPGSVKSLNLTPPRYETVLALSCDMSPMDVVADATHVYYTEHLSDEVKRIPVGGGTLPTTVALANGLVYHGALVVDDTYVYFGDEDGIQRAPKAGGDVVTLAAGYDSGSLAIDDTYVYWTETSYVDPDAIRRVRKAGGAVETILSGSTLTDPSDVAVDASYVYWTEGLGGGGRVARVDKTGETILELAPAEPNYGAGFIAVNDDHVYWVDTTTTATGRLRRVLKGGGGTVDDLVLGLFGAGGVNLSATHVYWGDSQGLWRLPLDASAVAVDLTIDALEITQGIQNLANAVPLVQDKTTFVRVYPAVDIADTANVTAVLHGERDGIPLPGSPLSAVVPSLEVQMEGYDRSFLSNSFNFWLPESWRSGSVTLRAQINPDGTIPETDADNNSFSRSTYFYHKDPLCVNMVRVRTSPTTASVSDTGFWEIVDFLKAIYPVPDVWIHESGKVEEYGGPFELPHDGSAALDAVYWYHVFSQDQPGCHGNAHYYGMIHPSETSWYGLGYRPGEDAIGVMNVDPGVLGGTAPDWFVPAGGHILAHELGHNFGRKHVDCPAGGPDGIDTNYPYNECDIAPDDPAGYYGFYLPEQAVIPPTDAADLMTYSHWINKPQWISDYTYRAIYNNMPGAQTESQIATSPLAQEVMSSVETLAVSGIVTPTEGTGMLQVAYRLEPDMVPQARLAELAASIDANPDAAYALALLDAGDLILSSTPFDLVDPGDPVDDSRPFGLVVPFHPDTAAIVLLEGGDELARLTVSPSPPHVEVLGPSNEDIVDSMTITWVADDPDGDVLRFTVQYSPDGGETWQALATNYHTTTLVIDDLGGIPGSDLAMVRVIATDGVNTASAMNYDPCYLHEKPPDVHISLPVDASVYPTGTQIILMGGAIDAEDGTLDSEDLEWFLDGASVGTGKEQAIRGLDVGQYSVTLVATDSDNDTAEAQVTIFVGVHKVYLPVVVKQQ